MRAAGRPDRRTAVLGLLLVVLLGGCDIPGLASSAKPAATPSPSAGDSWILVERGRRSPTPVPVATRRPTQDALPPLPTPATALPAGTPTPPCIGTVPQGPPAGLTVVPGAGSATVSWYHVGDPGLVSFRLAAVPQRLVTGAQADPRWQTIPAGAGCRTMSATVTGLERDSPYIFWLDAVTRRYSGDGDRDITVARSGVVTIG